MKSTGLVAMVVLAFAVSGTSVAMDKDAITARVMGMNPEAQIESIRPTPIRGLNEVLSGGEVIYLSDNGRYLFHGALLDMEQRINLTDIVASQQRAKVLASIPDDEKIIFAPKGKVKHKIRVFTDTSCGYCKKLHEEIESYLAQGIQVEYVAFPRGGPRSPAFGQMQSVWCAANRSEAYTAAVFGNVPPAPACNDPVLSHYELGDKIGIQGTPAIYTEDGIQVGGYVPALELAAQLEAKAKAMEARGATQAKAP